MMRSMALCLAGLLFVIQCSVSEANQSSPSIEGSWTADLEIDRLSTVAFNYQLVIDRELFVETVVATNHIKYQFDDPQKGSVRSEFSGKGRFVNGIYSLNHDILVECYAGFSTPTTTPTELISTHENKATLRYWIRRSGRLGSSLDPNKRVIGTTWELIKSVSHGKDFLPDNKVKIIMRFDGTGAIILTEEIKQGRSTINEVELSLDLLYESGISKGKLFKGLYRFDKDLLIINFAQPNQARPISTDIDPMQPTLQRKLHRDLLRIENGSGNLEDRLKQLP